MALLNYSPTKTNLIKLKEDLKFAQQGYELLDQKRNILIMELMTLVDKTIDFQNKVEDALQKAFNAIRNASLDMGKLRLDALASGINIESRITIKNRRVMGVQLPVVDTNFEEHTPSFSPLDTSFWVDNSLIHFKETLKLLGKLAELKISILRLSKEVKKTIRKVNALEKIAIPNLHETVSYIRNRLEENERDMFVLMKMVKRKLENQKQNTEMNRGQSR